MKQFVPVSDEDWLEAASSGLVPVPYQTGVRCFHALRESGADVAPRPPEWRPATVEAVAGLLDQR